MKHVFDFIPDGDIQRSDVLNAAICKVKKIKYLRGWNREWRSLAFVYYFGQRYSAQALKFS